MGNPTLFGSDYLIAAKQIADLMAQFQSVYDRIQEDGALLPATLTAINRNDLQLGDLTGFQQAIKDFLATWNANNSVLGAPFLNKALVNKLL